MKRELLLSDGESFHNYPRLRSVPFFIKFLYKFIYFMLKKLQHASQATLLKKWYFDYLQYTTRSTSKKHETTYSTKLLAKR